MNNCGVRCANELIRRVRDAARYRSAHSARIIILDCHDQCAHWSRNDTNGDPICHCEACGASRGNLAQELPTSHKSVRLYRLPLRGRHARWSCPTIRLPHPRRRARTRKGYAASVTLVPRERLRRPLGAPCAGTTRSVQTRLSVSFAAAQTEPLIQQEGAGPSLQPSIAGFVEMSKIVTQKL